MTLRASHHHRHPIARRPCHPHDCFYHAIRQEFYACCPTRHSFGIINYRKVSSLPLSPLCKNLPRGKTTPGRRSPRRYAVDVAADTDTDFHRRDAAVRLWGGGAGTGAGLWAGRGLCIVSKAEEMPHVQAWSRGCLSMRQRQLLVE